MAPTYASLLLAHDAGGKLIANLLAVPRTPGVRLVLIAVLLEGLVLLGAPDSVTAHFHLGRSAWLPSCPWPAPRPSLWGGYRTDRRDGVANRGGLIRVRLVFLREFFEL